MLTRFILFATLVASAGSAAARNFPPYTPSEPPSVSLVLISLVVCIVLFRRSKVARVEKST